MADFLFAPVPNKEAIDFIKSKPVLSRSVFNKLLPELKALSYTISGVQAADVLKKTRDMIAELPAGGDWEDIKSRVVDQISPYFVSDTNPDGTPASAEDQANMQKAADRRAELLLRTHGQQAYATTQYKMMDEQRDLFPFWQYLSMGDSHVRATHAALDGVVLPADSEFWTTHFPPWDWGCRCQCVPLLRSEAQKMAEADKDKPPDNQRVLDAGAQAALAPPGRRLVRNGVSYYMIAPSEEGKPGAFTFHPGDLRMDTAMLKARYDEKTWGDFAAWAKTQQIETGTSVWDWLNGTPATGKPAEPEPGEHSLATALPAIEAGLAAIKDHEVAHVLGADGVSKFSKSGSVNAVKFSGSDFEQMDGATLTHNHPSGGSFSSSDVDLAITANLAQMRAVGTLPDGRAFSYSLTAPPGGWRASVGPVILRDYAAISAEVQNEFVSRIAAGDLTAESAGDLHAHEVMSRLAAKYPKIIFYERTAIRSN
jgi:SPP1 gp7 family putative phage head morphogenesis protein